MLNRIISIKLQYLKYINCVKKLNYIAILDLVYFSMVYQPSWVT